MIDLSLGITFSLVAVIISIWLIKRKRKMSIFQRYNIPGPKPSFWTGNLKEIEKFQNKSFEYHLIKTYGKYVGFYVGANPIMLIADPELLKAIQIKDFKNFTNKNLIFPDAGIPHKSVLQGVELLKDEEWKNSRSYLTMALTTGKIKKMSPLMRESINNFLKKIHENKQKPFNIVNLCKNLTFDLTCKVVFGITTDVQNSITSKFTDSVYYVLNFGWSFYLDFFAMCFPELEPLPSYIRWMVDSIRNMLNMTSLRVVVAYIQGIIETRKKMSENQPADLMQSMIDANFANQDEDDEIDTKINKSKLFTMSDDAILGNSIFFVLGSYETLGGTLGYCSYLLSENPDCQQKAREEINKHIDETEPIEYSDLQNLQYLDQILSETLRLYPFNIPAINRVCKSDYHYNNITIPKDVTVTVPLWFLHHDPGYWFSPEKFIPERFSPENIKNIDSYRYQPFGAGPRMCIGMKLTQMTVKLILANLIRSFRLEKVNDDKELELAFQLFFVRPKEGIYVKAVPL